MLATYFSYSMRLKNVIYLLLKTIIDSEIFVNTIFQLDVYELHSIFTNFMRFVQFSNARPTSNHPGLSFNICFVLKNYFYDPKIFNFDFKSKMMINWICWRYFVVSGFVYCKALFEILLSSHPVYVSNGSCFTDTIQLPTIGTKIFTKIRGGDTSRGLCGTRYARIYS